MSNEIQLAVPESEQAWTLTQRKAKALTSASLVPEIYRGTNGLANAIVALEMAERLGASPLLVMQNLHVIQGRPSWSASFLIATVNQCGRFTPLRFETRGDDPRADDYRVRAYAEDKASGERCVGEWIDWQLVKGEGWNKKPGSKWITMPGQMFRYRAAAFWTRVFAPEVSMGIYTADEIEDMGTTNRGVATVDLRERMAEVLDTTATVGAESAHQASQSSAPAPEGVDADAEPQTASEGAGCPSCGHSVADMPVRDREDVMRLGTCPRCLD